MNYIKCPNCGKEISSGSTSCLYCGISRNIIEQELKIKELKKTKELPSEKESYIQAHKKQIILLELFIIVISIVIYAYSYLPRILEYSKIEREKNMIEKCKGYGGTWNEQNSTCETEVGIIDMK